MSVVDRSVSRGRQGFQSTGRGGVGNIRQTSISRPESGPDDFSSTRGREPIRTSTQIFSTGRGGAGNMRSPSRDNDNKVPKIEEDVIRDHKASQEGAPVSSGRGGLGNFNRSRTREPVTKPIVHSTGRGEVGHIVAGNGSIAKSIDGDEDDSIKDKEHSSHSTGRGRNANITTKHDEPPIERKQHIADGHGGAEQIVKETT